MLMIDSLGIEFCIDNAAKLIAFMDLDGTLTDGTVLYDGQHTARRFNLQDGHAINEAKGSGIVPIVVTSSPITSDIKQRIGWLDIPVFTSHGKTGKLMIPTVCDLLNNFDCGHIGDDLNDLSLLTFVKHPFIPSNANPKLGISLDKIGIKYTKLESSGGNGAVRDYLYELISIYQQ